MQQAQKAISSVLMMAESRIQFYEVVDHSDPHRLLIWRDEAVVILQHAAMIWTFPLGWS